MFSFQTSYAEISSDQFNAGIMDSITQLLSLGFGLVQPILAAIGFIWLLFFFGKAIFQRRRSRR